MICYIILHYNGLQVTRQCLDSLLQISSSSPVILVDNGSVNDSCDILEKEYGGSITILRNGKNEGFAKGNNVGYSYAKKKYNPDIMVVMNDDIIINQKDFEEKTVEYFKKSKTDVTGPDIVTPDSHHQNPLLRKPRKSLYCIKMLVIDTARYLLLKTHIFTQAVIKDYVGKGSIHKSTVKIETEIKDCILHGSCIVFGKRYIENENIAFLPVTFLYGEEMILYDYLVFRGYTTAINHQTIVTHLGGQSSDRTLTRERFLFAVKNEINMYYRILTQRMKYKLFRFRQKSRTFA